MLFRLWSRGIAVMQGHLSVLQFQDTLVADSHPKDARSQIFQSGLCAAHRLAMYHPIHVPHSRRDLPAAGGLLQRMAGFDAKYLGESLDRE